MRNPFTKKGKTASKFWHCEWATWDLGHLKSSKICLAMLCLAHASPFSSGGCHTGKELAMVW